MAPWVYDNTVIHGRRRRWCWAPGSRTRRAAHDDDWFWVLSTPQELSDHVSSGDQATSNDRSDWRSSATTDQDFIDDYPIIRVTSWWDLNNEAQRINMVGRSNCEAINSSSNYPTINGPMTIKCNSSSSNHTPLQPELQHGSTTWPNLWDRSGLPLLNRCALSDR
jgi:hypothetical protein